MTAHLMRHKPWELPRDTRLGIEVIRETCRHLDALLGALVPGENTTFHRRRIRESVDAILNEAARA